MGALDERHALFIDAAQGFLALAIIWRVCDDGAEAPLVDRSDSVIETAAGLSHSRRGVAGTRTAVEKAVVGALTRVTANEVGSHSMTVSSICPGPVLSEKEADSRDPVQVDEWTAKSPLGRRAFSEGVAEVVAFLASDKASYITGEALSVSGGTCTW